MTDPRDRPSTDGRQRIDARVHGHVQGVGFRWFVNRLAARLGLAGWVRNEPDGSVRVVAEGPDEALDELVRALHRGPSGARVDRVDLERNAGSGGAFARFEIRSGGHRGD